MGLAVLFTVEVPYRSTNSLNPYLFSTEMWKTSMDKYVRTVLPAQAV